MKFIKPLLFSVFLLFVMVSFSQCSSSKKMQKKAPVKIVEVYSQDWVAGIQGGGAGTNVFIKIADGNPVSLDSLYFRKKVTPLELASNNNYVAYFLSHTNRGPDDLIMSGNAKEEFGNSMPLKQEKFPFELKDNEAVVSYKDNGKTKYFKIQDIEDRPSLAMPSSSPNNGLN